MKNKERIELLKKLWSQRSPKVFGLDFYETVLCVFDDLKAMEQSTPVNQDYLDKCAIAAMQGIMSNVNLTDFLRGNDDRPVPSMVSELSYQIAEAMLAERERRVKQ